MKKKILVVFLIVLSMYSCEKDDFCTEEAVTPNLIVKFMDYDNLSKSKKTDSLYIWAVSKDSLYKKSKLDSIILPLNTSTKFTTYNLSKGKDSISQLNFEYNVKDEYISRSCGFKSTFSNIKITKKKLSKSWIDSLSVTNITTINNQTNAHIIIYH